jgi:hypothetical protein
MGERNFVARGNMSHRKFVMPQYTEILLLGQCPGARQALNAQYQSGIEVLGNIFVARSLKAAATDDSKEPVAGIW